MIKYEDVKIIKYVARVNCIHIDVDGIICRQMTKLSLDSSPSLTCTTSNEKRWKNKWIRLHMGELTLKD